MINIASLTMYLENGNNIITFTKLNNVCEFAICLAGSVGFKYRTTALIGLFNTNINKIVPIILKHKCIVAALFAFLLAPILDISDVVQLPILSPYKIGSAPDNGINP